MGRSEECFAFTSWLTGTFDLGWILFSKQIHRTLSLHNMHFCGERAQRAINERGARVTSGRVNFLPPSRHSGSALSQYSF